MSFCPKSPEKFDVTVRYTVDERDQASESLDKFSTHFRLTVKICKFTAAR